MPEQTETPETERYAFIALHHTQLACPRARKKRLEPSTPARSA